jgi:HK97 family phage major capsid protein
MEMQEMILKAIEESDKKLASKIEEKLSATALKSDVETIKTELAEKMNAMGAKSEALEAQLKKLDEMAARFTTKGAVKDHSFGALFAEGIEKAYDNIQRVGPASSFSLNLKTVGTMTVADNLTGDPIATQNPKGPTILPGHMVNLRDLVGTFPSATGFYVNYRETGGEGSVGLTSAGGSKSQKDYDFQRFQTNGVYVSAYTRIAKEMLQDLPFLQTVLPQLLLRDFYKKENSTFFNDLKSAATGGGSVTAGEDIENIIEQIGKMNDADYNVNGICLLPSKVAAIQITKPSNYSLPGAVTLSPNGGLTINGIPVYKSSWAQSGYMTMGDWSNARLGVVDGVKVEFFEQDSDNVTKNLVTVRVEAREFLAIDDPAAFSHRAFS